MLVKQLAAAPAIGSFFIQFASYPVRMSAEKTFKPRPRIEAFSDLIFGLALSIGALTLIGQQLTS